MLTLSQLSPPSTNDPFSTVALEFDFVRERLAALCATPMGRALAAGLEPAPAAEEARERLARAAEAILLERTGRAPSLRGLSNPAPLANHLAAGGRPLEPADLALLAVIIHRARDVRELLLQAASAAPKLSQWGGALPDLTDLAKQIDAAVDARGEIQDSASPKLAEASARRRALESEVDRVIAGILMKPDVRKALGSTKPIYRNNRPALAVRAEYRARVPGLLLDRSSTGGTVFIEPVEVVELGNALAEVAVVIAREIAAVLLELSRAVLARRDRIVLLSALLGDLDLEFAKATFAMRIHCCIPEIVANRKLKLTGARHPKLHDDAFPELTTARQSQSHHPGPVPIDVELGGEYDLLLITGPNTGGKTVALKTVGLLSVMALSGLPIPARAACVPAFQGVFVDVGDEQEISQSLSTFSSHMVRVARAVINANSECLVLLDEVGAGTDPAEGSVLGEAILEHFLARGVRVIATTHLGRLKEMAYRLPRVENGTVEFDPETLKPRYRLIVGMPGASHALAVARRVGIPGAIVDIAASRLDRHDDTTEATVAAIQQARIDTEAARRRADDLVLEAEARISKAKDLEAALAGREMQLSAEAQRAVDESHQRVRTAVLERLDTMARAAPRPFDQMLREFKKEIETVIEDSPIEQKRLAFVNKLKRDDIVYIPKLRRRCQVRRVHRDRRVVTVMVGEMPTDVRFDEVTWYEVL